MGLAQYEPHVTGRFPGRTTLAAYTHLVVRMAGTVLLTTAFWALVFDERLRMDFLRRGHLSPSDLLAVRSNLWGIDLSGPFLGDVVAFTLTRATSPLVVWPVVIAGVVALAIEYRRGRFDSVLERLG